MQLSMSVENNKQFPLIHEARQARDKAYWVHKKQGRKCRRWTDNTGPLPVFKLDIIAESLGFEAKT